MSPRSQARPSRRAVVVAFGIAIAAAAALVAVALISKRSSDSAPPAATPVVALGGIPQDGAVLGNSGAKVALIEYADLQCPACRLYTEEFFPTLVDEYVRTGKVKAEFRGFPFIGDDSVKAHRFLLAAARQNKLWNLQEALYRNQGGENSGWVTDDLIRRVAGEIPGLDADQLFADASLPAIEQEAAGAGAAASSAGITGTPTFLIGIGDQQPYLVSFGALDQMRAALDDALSA
ncbi:MAG TPA: thioredoxin domain-containing protein [Gaiellaceae bacterium]|nr:thioredoxin domain-containing protein [Gaiellaceae bacterium]